MPFLSKQFVGGAEHFELSAAVQLVAYLLMLPGLLLDEILGEHIVFLQPGIFLRELPADCFRAFLAISHRGKAIFFNAVSYEVIHYRLGAALRQSLVVLAVAFVIAMGTQFDGYVGILFQQGPIWSFFLIFLFRCPKAWLKKEPFREDPWISTSSIWTI